ncbi:MAG TPA: hypothetical protein VN914_11725, partial [Polyangia bacterium]|nr:hypothetical protein [Polyangia bacterium]
MQESVDLAVDPSSPDAPVEDRFFKQGVDAEVQTRYEAHPPADDWQRRNRRLRIAATSAITTVGLVAVGLLIWGGPSSPSPATVAVVAPAAAESAPVLAPPPPAPAPRPAEPAPAPAVVATAVPVPAAEPAPAAPTIDARLEQSCRDAFGRKRYKDVLD